MSVRIAPLVLAFVLLSVVAHAADAVDPLQTFKDNCVECHGEDAKGLKDAGLDLTTSAFVKGMTDAQFAEFLKVGRAAADRTSKTGQLMPAFDYLSDAEMKAVIAFVRGKAQ